MTEDTHRAQVTAARKAASGELLQVHAAAEFAGWRLRMVDTGKDGAQVWTFDRNDRAHSTLDRVLVHVVGADAERGEIASLFCIPPHMIGEGATGAVVTRVVTRLGIDEFVSEARRTDFDWMGAFEFVWPAFAG